MYSANLAENTGHLERVFECLARNSFYLKPFKCLFGKDTIEYLNHFVSKKRVLADPAKVEAMVTWPVPRNLKQLRGFLGLTGYYCSFIRHYATIAAPLIDLLRKDAFKWSVEAKTAFGALKTAMTTTQVLRLLNFTLPFVVESNASNTEAGPS